MVKGWFCHDCNDNIGNCVKGLGDVSLKHRNHKIQHQSSMTKCNSCELLSGGYREDTMCYDPDCKGRFKLI